MCPSILAASAVVVVPSLASPARVTLCLQPGCTHSRRRANVVCLRDSDVAGHLGANRSLCRHRQSLPLLGLMVPSWTHRTSPHQVAQHTESGCAPGFSAGLDGFSQPLPVHHHGVASPKHHSRKELPQLPSSHGDRTAKPQMGTTGHSSLSGWRPSRRTFWILL